MLLFSKKSNIYFFKQVCQIKEKLSYRNCKPSFKVYKVKRQAFIL